MKYTKSNVRHSTNYRGTTTDRNDPDLLALKVHISEENKRLKAKGYPQLRVCLRGRKPKEKMYVKNFWTNESGVRGYDFGGNVVGGLDNATVFDVYVYERY